MSVCALILCLCCSVRRQQPCNGLIPRPRSPTDCVKNEETEKSSQGLTKGCRATESETDRQKLFLETKYERK
jgi:hypothetical protein